MWFVFFFFRGRLYATNKGNWLYDIAEWMTEIIRAFIMIIQSDSSVRIGKSLYCILHGTGLFMGKPDKSHCGIWFYLCKTSETSKKQ